MTIDNELEEAAYEMETSLFDEDSHPDLLREAANHIRAQAARIAALTKDAEPATTCPRIELVVAIHSLASDFENMSYSFGADTEDRKRAQGSIKHAMAVANKHNQNGAGCITHPPAPKAITADMVTDEMVKTSVFVNVFNAKQQIANVVNAFNGVNP